MRIVYVQTCNIKIRLCTAFSVLKTTLVQVRHRISSSLRETNLKGPLTTLSNIPTLPEGNHRQLWWQSNLLKSEGSFSDTRGFSLFIDPTAMPCWWAPRRAKQLSMAVTARVIWLCTCVTHCPGRGNTAAKRLRMRQVEHFRSLFQSHFPVSLPRVSFCVQLVVQLFCFMLLVFLTIL